MTKSTNKSYRLSINNFLSVEELELDLSSGVTGITGENGKGKTNILTAVESILKGSHDTRLIKDGETRSEIRLEELDENEDVVASVSRVQTLKQNTLKGKLPSTETPKKWLTKLLDEVAINPIRLISDDPVAYLKKHLDVYVETSEIRPFNALEGDFVFDHNTNSFDECDRAADEVATVRRSDYKIMRHAEEVLKELKLDLDDLPEALAFTKESLDEQRTNIQAQINNTTENMERKKRIGIKIVELKNDVESYQATKLSNKEKFVFHDNRVIDIEDNYTKYLSQTKSNHDQKLRDLEAEYIKAKNESEKIYEATLIKAKESKEKSLKKNDFEKLDVIKQSEIADEKIKNAKKNIEDLNEDYDKVPMTSIDKLNLEKNKVLSQLKEIEDYDALKKRHDRVDEKEEEYTKIKEKYDELDKVFKWYRYVLPKYLLERAELPVKDLSFQENELYVGELHIDRLSTAERYLVAIKLAIALAKAKGHICVAIDGIECFTKENRVKLMKEISNSGIRVLYTRCGEKEFDHEIELK